MRSCNGKENLKGESTYENRFENRTVFGGCDLRCFRPEWIPALHPLSTAPGLGRTIHGRPVRLALPDCNHGGSGHRGGTSAGQPFRAVGAGCLAPVIVNILCFYAFLAPSGLALALFLG